MNIVLSILLALLPIILISIFIILFDKEKEPLFSYIKCYFMGFFAVCVVLLFNSVTGLKLDIYSRDFVYLFVYSFVFVGLLEEVAKFLSTMIIMKIDKHFNSYFDSIVYAAFVAMGFACLENIIYIVNDNFNINTVILRAVFSVPSHVIFSVFMGKFIELFRTKEKGRVLYLLLAVIIPVLLHGLYDFVLLYVPNLVSTTLTFYVILISFEIILYIIGIREIVLSSKNSRNIMMDPHSSFKLDEKKEEKKETLEKVNCPLCGHVVEGYICPNCKSVVR